MGPRRSCAFCGFASTAGHFKKWDGKWVCKSARACLGRARVGGYRP